MTLCCMSNGAQCCCQPQDGTPCQFMTAEGLNKLADTLNAAAKVNGSMHQQADWQRISQNRAATVLRYFALGVQGAPGSTDSERAAWLADKIGGDLRPHGEPVSPSGGVWVEWEHLCTQKGERVLTTKDRRCRFCGMHEDDRDSRDTPPPGGEG